MKAEVQIENLKCGGWVKTATEGAAVLDGISNVIVSLENNSIPDFVFVDSLQVLIKLLIKLIDYT